MRRLSAGRDEGGFGGGGRRVWEKDQEVSGLWEFGGEEGGVREGGLRLWGGVVLGVWGEVGEGGGEGVWV